MRKLAITCGCRPSPLQGSCVAFAVLLGDFVPALICMNGCDTPAAQAFHPPHVILFMLGAAVLYPLSLFRQLNALRHTSALSAVCILYTAAMITARAGKDHQPGSDLSMSTGGTGVFIALPIFMVAYTLHYNSAKYYGEMVNRTPGWLLAVVVAAFSIVTVLYVATAVAGYVLFADDTCSDILLNFDRNDPAAVVARIALSIIVIACFPLAFNALRGAFTQLLPQSWRDRIELTGPYAPHGAGGAGSYALLTSEDAAATPALPSAGGEIATSKPAPEHGGPRGWGAYLCALCRANWAHAAVTKCLILLSIVIALLVPNIGTVLAYKVSAKGRCGRWPETRREWRRGMHIAHAACRRVQGAIGGSLVTVVFPAWIHFALVQRRAAAAASSGTVDAHELGDLKWEWRDLVATRHGLLATICTAWGFALMVMGVVVASQPSPTPPNCTAAQQE